MVYAVGQYDSTFKMINSSNNLLTSLRTLSFNNNSTYANIHNNYKPLTVNLMDDVYDRFDKQSKSDSLENTGVLSKKHYTPVKKEFL